MECPKGVGFCRILPNGDRIMIDYVIANDSMSMRYCEPNGVTTLINNIPNPTFIQYLVDKLMNATVNFVSSSNTNT